MADAASLKKRIEKLRAQNAQRKLHKLQLHGVDSVPQEAGRRLEVTAERRPHQDFNHVTGGQAGSQLATKANKEPSESQATQVQSSSKPGTPEGNLLHQWSKLLVTLAGTRLRKKRAVQGQDYAEAGRLKQLELDLEARVKAAQEEAVTSGAEEERQRLEAGKRRAVEEEDYVEAGRLKKRLRLLEEDGPIADDLALQAWGAALSIAKRMTAAEDGPSIASDLHMAAPPASVLSQVQDGSESNPEVAYAAEGASLSQCSVPHFTVAQLLAAANEDLWQKAWETTWLKAHTDGGDCDQDVVYAAAQTVWKEWMEERDALGTAWAAAAGRKKAEEIKAKKVGCGHDAAVRVAAVAQVKERVASVASSSLARSEGLRLARRAVDSNAVDEASWHARARLEAKATEGKPLTSAQDLCALLKRECPADQPLRLESLLAACPPPTSVQQLLQAMADDPQGFRQSWDGSEYCVSPVNSRCRDWLPVQTARLPFRALPQATALEASSAFQASLPAQSQATDASTLLGRARPRATRHSAQPC